jgi:hypothetical protein
MSGIFMLMGLFLLFICAVLYLMPNLEILNFVAYGTDQTQRKVNRVCPVAPTGFRVYGSILLSSGAARACGVALFPKHYFYTGFGRVDSCRSYPFRR